MLRILLSWNVPVLTLHTDDYLLHVAWVRMHINLHQPSCTHLSPLPHMIMMLAYAFSSSLHTWEPSRGAWCKFAFEAASLFCSVGLSSEGCTMSSVFSFLKQALGLFWHLCKCCFPAAALVLASQQTDLKLTQNQHTVFPHSSPANIFPNKHIVYPVSWWANCLTPCNLDLMSDAKCWAHQSASVLFPSL